MGFERRLLHICDLYQNTFADSFSVHSDLDQKVQSTVALKLSLILMPIPIEVNSSHKFSVYFFTFQLISTRIYSVLYR